MDGPGRLVAHPAGCYQRALAQITAADSSGTSALIHRPARSRRTPLRSRAAYRSYRGALGASQLIPGPLLA
jgi:hypothetical protein